MMVHLLSVTDLNFSWTHDDDYVMNWMSKYTNFGVNISGRIETFARNIDKVEILLFS